MAIIKLYVDDDFVKKAEEFASKYTSCYARIDPTHQLSEESAFKYPKATNGRSFDIFHKSVHYYLASAEIELSDSAIEDFEKSINEIEENELTPFLDLYPVNTKIEFDLGNEKLLYIICPYNLRHLAGNNYQIMHSLGIPEQNTFYYQITGYRPRNNISDFKSFAIVEWNNAHEKNLFIKALLALCKEKKVKYELKSSSKKTYPYGTILNLKRFTYKINESFLSNCSGNNAEIFKILNINQLDFYRSVTGKNPRNYLYVRDNPNQFDTIVEWNNDTERDLFISELIKVCAEEKLEPTRFFSSSDPVKPVSAPIDKYPIDSILYLKDICYKVGSMCIYTQKHANNIIFSKLGINQLDFYRDVTGKMPKNHFFITGKTSSIVEWHNIEEKNLFLDALINECNKSTKVSETIIDKYAHIATKENYMVGIDPITTDKLTLVPLTKVEKLPILKTNK